MSTVIGKVLKGLLLSKAAVIKKTHDLGFLAELLQEYLEVPDYILDICGDLTPYGVKIRYPQELFIKQ